MNEIAALLMEVQSGKTTFKPESSSEADRRAFQSTAKALVHADTEGFLAKCMPHRESETGNDWYDQVVVLGGLSYKGIQYLKNPLPSGSNDDRTGEIEVSILGMSVSAKFRRGIIVAFMVFLGAVALWWYWPQIAPRLFPKAVPALISPANGDRLSGYPREMVFEWSPFEGADRYILEVEVQELSTGQFHPHPFDSRMTTTETQVEYEFVGDQPGRWRVIAVDPDGNNTASLWWEFFWVKISIADYAAYLQDQMPEWAFTQIPEQPTPMTWDEANQYCQSLGNRLPTASEASALLAHPDRFVEVRSLIEELGASSFWLDGRRVANVLANRDQVHIGTTAEPLEHTAGMRALCRIN